MDLLMRLFLPGRVKSQEMAAGAGASRDEGRAEDTAPRLLEPLADTDGDRATAYCTVHEWYKYPTP
eukprot:scaffold202831_cov18-Prasinocladus_malaysianus.AAC.1